MATTISTTNTDFKMRRHTPITAKINHSTTRTTNDYARRF